MSRWATPSADRMEHGERHTAWELHSRVSARGLVLFVENLEALEVVRCQLPGRDGVACCRGVGPVADEWTFVCFVPGVVAIDAGAIELLRWLHFGCRQQVPRG